MLTSALLLFAAIDQQIRFPASQQGEWSTSFEQCGRMTTGTILVAPDRLYFWESEFEPRDRHPEDENRVSGTWFELDEPSNTTLSLTITDDGKLILKTEWSEEEYVRCENSDLLIRNLNGKA